MIARNLVVDDDSVSASRDDFRLISIAGIPGLLETLRTDGLRFFGRVCFTRYASMEFDDIPVLAAITPEDFVKAFLASPKAGWHWVSSALKERNKGIVHFPSLRPEGAWLSKVIDLMRSEATGMVGFARVRLLRAIDEIGLPAPTDQEEDDRIANM